MKGLEKVSSKVKAKRYHNVTKELYGTPAEVFIEVGTWSGDRAIELMNVALVKAKGPFKYIGFDLFESITPEKSTEEFNVKAPHSKAAVRSKIQTWATQRAVNDFIDFELVAGDTRETLPEYLSEHGTGFVDFAWIDGGHSVETIHSDWTYVSKMMKPGGVVLLDDYYENLPDPTAIERFGCNKLVEELKASGFEVKLFEELDPVRGGGFVRIAKVTT